MQDRKYISHKLKNIPTDNFLMTPLELRDYIDFEVKRVYFLSDAKGEFKTGAHCHRKEEDELFVMISGSCIAVVDDGHGLEEVKLTGKEDAIFIPRLVWHHFKDLSEDAVLLAISSTNYNPERSDYCEDYSEFQQLLKDEGDN